MPDKPKLPRKAPSGTPFVKGGQVPKGRPFVKGQSGNPGGKTKEAAWLREEARKLAAKSLATLADVLDTGSGSERVAAARELLDRGFGKSTQLIAGDPDGDPVKMNMTVIFRKVTETSEKVSSITNEA